MKSIGTIEKNFLQKHGIKKSQVFNAFGLRARDWKERVSNSRYLVAINVTPCQAHNHKLRDASGHCIICNPRKLEHRKQYKEAGKIYIAYSEKHKLIKVGRASFKSKRVKSLNQSGYGGINDWELKHEADVEANSGAVEDFTHQLLSEYRHDLSFMRGNGQIEKSREIFKCSIRKALNALNEAINEFC